MVGGAQERQEAAIPEATVGTAATSAGDDLPPRRPPRRAAAPGREDDAFVTTLRAFLSSHTGGRGGRPLKVPIFCHAPLDLKRVYDEVSVRGGFDGVTASKRWLEVCRTLGHVDLSGNTSAGFQIRQCYERCLLDFELHKAGKSPRPALAETDDGARGVAGNPMPAAQPRYPMSKKEEEATAKALGLEEIGDDERQFIFPGANEYDYLHVRCSILARWRFEPSLHLSLETACDWYNPKFTPLVKCAYRFLTSRGYVNFG
eukprot:CAMPEP_0181390542 /NCGR_PEP_ID=MMETSP1106-20121128/25540_1 /TAXON_ID=81844 /ORGANISM="Mantoniella antarctica, Strain SL-175" /LENGTH=258 /DNA_ID=CAMNT_0023511459 /DNA_START=270 /DNA_END=1042 /DNA_ORIENTATION=-